MEKLEYQSQLNKLSKSAYAIQNLESSEKTITAKNFIRIMLVFIISGAIFTFLGKVSGTVFGFNMAVTSNNRGDYLSLFATHCSVVFLTTSLMTMLSEKSKFVYHIDLVELVLINPPYYNFFALAVYAIGSVFLAMLGLLHKCGSVIIGGFLLGVVAVVILFARMVLIYYLEKYQENKIRKFLYDIIKIVRTLEDEKKINPYREMMGKIGYLVHFEKIVDQALLELENHNVKAVIKAVKLLEDCIMWHVGTTYDNEQKSVEKTFDIMISDIGLNRSYRADTRLDLEHIYIKFASVVAKKHPEELHRYYNKEGNKHIPDYLKMIRSTVFPYILNSYIDDGKKQQFFICLTKWDKLNEFWPAIKKYLVSIALEGKWNYLAEYYDKVRYSSAIDFETAQTSEDENSGIGSWVSPKSTGGAIFIKHEQIIEEIYHKSVEAFEAILSFKDNRKIFIDAVSKNEYAEINWDKDPIQKCIYLSESALKNELPKEFHYIFLHWNRLMISSENNDLKDNLYLIVNYIIDLDNYSVRKTNADVEYLLGYIYKAIYSLEFKNVMTILCQNKSVQEIDEYFDELIEAYTKALENGINKLEYNSSYCDDKNNPRNSIDRIEILKKLLEKIQAEKGDL